MTNTHQFVLKVYRLEKGSGKRGDPLVKKDFLKDFHLPITIPDIIEQIGRDYGGGKYKIYIMGDGKYIKSKTFEIAGKSKPILCNCDLRKLMTTGCKNRYHI